MARPKGRRLPNRVSVALTDQQLTALESLAQESQAAVSWVLNTWNGIARQRQATAGQHKRLWRGSDDGTGDYQF
jgi:hypothetical protein